MTGQGHIAEVVRLRRQPVERTRGPTLADVLSAVEELRSEVQLLGLALERRRGGAPGGYGLRREAIVQAVVAKREPDGSWPTQQRVAEALGYSVERVKQTQGPRGWAGILADAERLLRT